MDEFVLNIARIEMFIRVGWINRPCGKRRKMNRVYIIIAAVVAVALIASGAFAYVYYEGQAVEAEKIKNLQSLVDDHDYETSLEDYPNRIISLAPSCTEILFALDLDDKVVAVTDYDNYPYNFSAWVQAGNMTSVGAFDKPNMEVIASLNPDLILATAGVQGETVDTMRDLGYKVLVLDPANINGVFKNIELVGKATGKNAEATSLVNSLNSRIDAVVSKVASATSKPKVYYEVWYDPTSLWSAGSKAWQNELIEKAGGTNIFADQPIDYFQSSAEAVVDRNPEVIVLPAGGMGFGPPFWGSIDEVKARPGWDSISAVQNNKLFQIDSDVIARAGPRVADAVEALAGFFHPELF
jgi:iron complex transport system substrate-binding protein